MADQLTPNLGLIKPDVGASDDTWGEKLNSNFDKIDTAVALPPNIPPEYVTDAELAVTLDGYISDAELTTILGGYTSDAELATALASYVTQAEFPEGVDDRVAALLKAGANVTLTYDDAANTLTISSTGGGGGGGASVTISATPPASPTAGNLWWESDTGLLFIYYNDGDSSQWVVVLGGGGSSTGVVRYDTAQTLTAAQKVQARANIDVLKKNYIVNGAMQISQELGGAPMSIGGYPVDMFIVTGNTTGTFTHVQAASPTPAGSPNRLRITVGTADAAVTASKYFIVQTKIEGLRMPDLKFGTAAAKIITIQFGVKAPAGTYSVSLYNAAALRTYAGEYTIVAGEANTDVVKSVTLTADITGSWPSDNNGTLVINWSLMCASNLAVAPGVWGGGAALGSTNQFNVFGTAGAVFELFDVGLYEGAVAPAFQVPDFTTELILCQRYYHKLAAVGAYTGFGTGVALAATNGSFYIKYATRMRAAPAMTYGGSLMMVAGSGNFVISSIVATYAGLDSMAAQFGTTGLTLGAALNLMSNNDATAFIAFNARL
jgi:hypothetical protein